MGTKIKIPCSSTTGVSPQAMSPARLLKARTLNESGAVQYLDTEEILLNKVTALPVMHELVELALNRGASTRLRNSLLAAQNDGALDEVSIQSIALDEVHAIGKLLRLPNFGAKCMTELRALVASGKHEKIDRPVLVDSNQKNLPLFQYEISIESALDTLNCLTGKVRDVIRARLGLDNSQPKTLSTIGEEMGLTRERIRQIETNALRRLRTAFRETFMQMRLERQSSTLASLAVDQVVPDKEETYLFNSLDPEMRLLIRVDYASVKSWLDATCKRVEKGWLLPGMSIEVFQEAQHWLAAQYERLLLPCPISYLLTRDSLPEESIRSALHLSSELKVIDNYLLPARSTRRAQRAARIHHLMLCRGFACSITLSELKDTYRKRYPDDQCSARDLLVALFGNPHLFLNQYEMGWLPLGAEISATSSTSALDGRFQDSHDIAPAEDRNAVEEDVETLRGLLAQILLERGPQSFNDLRRLFVAKVGSKYSKASVGPILISTDEFARIGPGIYAHRRQLLDHALLADASDRLLLNKAQCETFCRAMWAGEDSQAYAMWTLDMQFRWGEWCYCTEQKELLSSLLAVCSVDNWPVKAGDLARWARLKESLSIYMLEEPHAPLTDRLPDFREFLSSAASAVKLGYTSWIGINRATGYRVDDRHSVSLLALLIAAGIVEPAIHWQQKHHTSERAKEILGPILSDAGRNGQSRWPKVVIRSMRTNYESLLEPGWTTSESIHTLFDAMNQEAIRDELLESDAAPVVDMYRQLKQKLKDDILFDRLRKRIALGIAEFKGAQ